MAASRRIFPRGAFVSTLSVRTFESLEEPAILIPLDKNRSGGCAGRAARATRWLWSRGIYPSPSAVNMRMRGWTRDCLNGVETKARNAVMAELGISRQRHDDRFLWRSEKRERGAA